MKNTHYSKYELIGTFRLIHNLGIIHSTKEKHFRGKGRSFYEDDKK